MTWTGYFGDAGGPLDGVNLPTPKEQRRQSALQQAAASGQAQMPGREAYEAWAAGRGFNTGLMWEAWQASRQQFGEEAIDLVAFHGGSVEIEAAIRSLSHPTGGKE